MLTTTFYTTTNIKSRNHYLLLSKKFPVKASSMSDTIILFNNVITNSRK